MKPLPLFEVLIVLVKAVRLIIEITHGGVRRRDVIGRADRLAVRDMLQKHNIIRVIISIHPQMIFLCV